MLMVKEVEEIGKDLKTQLDKGLKKPDNVVKSKFKEEIGYLGEAIKTCEKL